MREDSLESERKREGLWSFGPQRTVLRSFSAAIGKTAVLLPVSFIASTGMGIFNLGIIYFMREVNGAQAHTVGWLAAVYNICYICGCFLLRPLGRRILPRFLLIMATTLMALFGTILLVTRSIPLAFVLYGCYGLANSLFWPPLMGWLSAGVEGEELNRTISRWNVSWSVGNIISPFITGVLAERNVRFPLYTGILLLLLVSVLITIAAIGLRRIRIDTHREPAASEPGSMDNDHSTYLRFPGWINIFSLYVILGVVANIFPMYGKDQLDLGETTIGIVLLVRSLFAAVGFIIIGRTAFWHFKGRYLIGNQIFLLVFLLVLIPFQSFAAYLCLMPFLGTISAFIYTNAMFHGVSGSVQRGKRTAIQESLLTLGIVLGSVLGGQLYQTASMKSVFILAFLIVLAGLAVQGVLVLTNRKRRAAAEGHDGGSEEISTE
jgi:MFS family permease